MVRKRKNCQQTVELGLGVCVRACVCARDRRELTYGCSVAHSCRARRRWTSEDGSRRPFPFQQQNGPWVEISICHVTMAAPKRRVSPPSYARRGGGGGGGGRRPQGWVCGWGRLLPCLLLFCSLFVPIKVDFLPDRTNARCLSRALPSRIPRAWLFIYFCILFVVEVLCLHSARPGCKSAQVLFWRTAWAGSEQFINYH